MKESEEEKLTKKQRVMKEQRSYMRKQRNVIHWRLEMVAFGQMSLIPLLD